MASLRILHVVGGMDRGGVETWLANVARRLPADEVRHTFVVHAEKDWAYRAELETLGHRFVTVPLRPLPRYLATIARLARDHHAVHSHVNNFSAVPLLGAALARTRVRIAHSHTDVRTLQQAASPRRRAYYAGTRATILATMTAGFASSEAACLSLFGRTSSRDGRLRVLPTGIDLTPFADTTRGGLREELGLAPNALLLGHLGRLVDVKNQAFLFPVVAELRHRGVDAHLVCVGEGPNLVRLRAAGAKAGVTEHVTFTGVRADVAAILATLDVLVMPSLYEGVPITLLEAQASGLPCVVADTIHEATDVVDGLLLRRSLQDPPGAWADAVLTQAARPHDVAAAQAAMQASPYDIDATVAVLLAAWRGEERP